MHHKLGLLKNNKMANKINKYTVSNEIFFYLFELLSKLFEIISLNLLEYKTCFPKEFKRQRRRIVKRIYKRRAPINNADTLSRITQLPLQITNDLFANQMFR